MASRRFFDRLRRRGLRGAPGRRRARPRARACPNATRRALRDVITELAAPARHDDAARGSRRRRRRVPRAVRRRAPQLPAHARARLLDRSPRGRRRVDRRAAELGDDRRAAERRLRDALVAARRPAAAAVHRARRRREVPRRPARRRAARSRAIDADLADLDRELKAQLATLFDVGLLELRRITWEAPAALLEKLIAYEAVHAISSWDDLKNRLDSDRRCYAFFHPAMPERAARVRRDRAHRRHRHRARAAARRARARRSTSNGPTPRSSIRSRTASPGSRASTSAPRSIKQVVEALRLDLPQLRRFVTLSPIPGFRSWVETRARRRRRAACATASASCCRPNRRACSRGCRTPEWDVDEAIRPALLALCARYLTTTRRRPRRRSGRELPPRRTARSVERIDWMADPSPTGRARSFGVMANYLYEPDRIAGAGRGVRGRGRGRRCRPRCATCCASNARASRSTPAGRGTRRARRRSVASGGAVCSGPKGVLPSSPRNAGWMNARRPSSSCAASSGSRSVD